MYTISKRFTFSASHQLKGLPDGHPCGRLHGHNYIVEIQLQSNQLDDTGFVMDFGDLSPLKIYIDEELDHRHLNDVLPMQTSSENIARHLFEYARSIWGDVVHQVGVSETPKTWAYYHD